MMITPLLVDIMNMKVTMFVIIQALVYVILSTSSNIFSDNNKSKKKTMKKKSASFKPAGSASAAVNRVLPTAHEPSSPFIKNVLKE